jgi:sporulation protein YlmC with PRC-barrel domain
MKDNVVNPQGENLGEIKDFMIDTENGRVVYAVLSFGGLWGIGDKLFALPMDALTVDTNNERFVTDIREDQLDDAPGFDKDNWPHTIDRDFVTRVYTHYGYEPYYERDLALA